MEILPLLVQQGVATRPLNLFGAREEKRQALTGRATDVGILPRAVQEWSTLAKFLSTFPKLMGQPLAPIAPLVCPTERGLPIVMVSLMPFPGRPLAPLLFYSLLPTL